jgi:hypothetical protein
VLSLSCCLLHHDGSLLRIFIHPEDRSDMFFFSKLRLTFDGLHGTVSQKTDLFKLTLIRTYACKSKTNKFPGAFSQRYFYHASFRRNTIGRWTDGLLYIIYQHTSEILQVWYQITAIMRISQQSKSREFFGSSLHIKVKFTLYCSLLSVQ